MFQAWANICLWVLTVFAARFIFCWPIWSLLKNVFANLQCIKIVYCLVSSQFQLVCAKCKLLFANLKLKVSLGDYWRKFTLRFSYSWVTWTHVIHIVPKRQIRLRTVNSRRQRQAGTDERETPKAGLSTFKPF